MAITPILRRVKTNELSSVSSLIRDTIHDCYVGIYPPRAVAFFLDYHRDVSITQRVDKGLVLVAVKDDEIIATGSLVGNDITGVFVKRNQQNTGIGNLLMDKLEECAIQAGHQEVQLSISLPSRGFYEQRGYHIVGAAEIDVGMGQVLKYWEGNKKLVR